MAVSKAEQETARIFPCYQCVAMTHFPFPLPNLFGMNNSKQSITDVAPWRYGKKTPIFAGFLAIFLALGGTCGGW